MMRRIRNGEPVFHVHQCSLERLGKEMTADELRNFAVDVLMSEYGDTNAEVIKYDKKSPNEADFCFVNTGKQPSFTGDNSKGKTVNVLVVYKDKIDNDISDIDTSWMVDEYYRSGSIPRITIATSWCISDKSENGKPAICGGQFCFMYHSISLVPGEVNEPLERKLTEVELAVKYKEAWENFDASIVAPYLDKDFHYGSDWVFDEMPSRFEYLTYFQGKLNAVKRGGSNIKFFIGRDHQTGDLAIVLLQKGEYSALNIKTREGRIVSACMKEYNKRFKEFNPADELYQNHGDHLDCIMPAQEFMSNHIKDILGASTLWRTSKTLVTNEDMYEQKTDVYSLMYGDNDIRVLTLISLSKQTNENLFMSTYPITKGVSYEVKIEKVIEWDNQIEATVLCSIGEFGFAFFAIDYYCNKNKYKAGRTINVDLSALAMNAGAARKEFRFEGQQAIDWLNKVGRDVAYDAEGNVEPVVFSLEKLVAFLDKDSKCPDEAEFQSPVEGIDTCSVLDVDFYKSNITICRREHEDSELIVKLPLYFRKDFIPEVKENDPIHGWLWITGSISGKHEKGESATTSKVCEICSEFEEFTKQCNFKSFMNLMHVLKMLPQLKIKDGYELDAFIRGDRHGSIMQAYCCKAGAKDLYIPTIENQCETKVKSKSILGLFGKEETEIVTEKEHVPYNDSLRIHGQINWGEGKDVPPALMYFEVPFTEEAIIQAWLLNNLTDFMPKGWHCNYSNKDYIFDSDNFMEQLSERFVEKTDVLNQILKVDFDTLLPSVSISDDKAVVEYAYWNDWQGLVKAKSEVYKDGDGVKFLELEKEILIKYDCGIMF